MVCARQEPSCAVFNTAFVFTLTSASSSTVSRTTLQQLSLFVCVCSVCTFVHYFLRPFLGRGPVNFGESTAGFDRFTLCKHRPLDAFKVFRRGRLSADFKKQSGEVWLSTATRVSECSVSYGLLWSV